MKGTGNSMSSVRSLLREFGVRRGLGPVLHLEHMVNAEGEFQQRMISPRWFSSDAGKTPDVSAETGEPEKKMELGSWWQAFSEQARAQSDLNRKSGNASETPRWSSSKGEQGGRSERGFSGGDGGDRRWLFPYRANVSGQGQQKPIDKGAISRLIQMKDTRDPSSDGERNDTSSSQIGARWLKSSLKKSAPEQESPNIANPSSSDISWPGLSKDTSTSNPEKMQASMQKLALMSKHQASAFSFLPPKDNLLREYFSWWNLSSPEKRNKTLTKVRQEFQKHKTDCGSSQVQIAQLTTKIKYMTKHMETHRKDYHSRKGLEAMVQQRRKILKYLRRKDWDTYCDVIAKLGLRDNVMDISRR